MAIFEAIGHYKAYEVAQWLATLSAIDLRKPLVGNPAEGEYPNVSAI